MPVDPLQPVLRHALREGAATAHLLRAGPVAAQLLLSDAPATRVLVAFAAGNSGVALWFEPLTQAAAWRLVGDTQVVTALDPQGRPLHGVEAVIEIDLPRLTLRRALLGSVRMLRDHQFDRRLPADGLVPPQVQAETARWQRDRLDGAAGYGLSLHAEAGCHLAADGEHGLLITATTAPLRLRLRALTGEPALTPLAAEQLLTPAAADLPEARRCLEFLAFQDKWMAGSWRFHTYFGRDTLMSLRLLLPVLRPEAVEAALNSVIDRLSPSGEVAHEEDIGEFAVTEHRRHGRAGDAPLFDYKMVDDDFMLLPVLAAWALETPAGAERIAAYLAAADAHGQPRGERVARNLGFVLASAWPFTQTPLAVNLIPLKPGEIVGDWRDSAEGLAHGRYAYSVNAALVPAALRAAQGLVAAGLLAPYLGGVDAQMLERLPQMACLWRERAPRCFQVSVSAPVAEVKLAEAASEFGVPPPAALAPDALQVHALSLDATCRPIPVMHSDFGFSLLLDEPSAERIAAELPVLMRPFPLGLLTGVGLLVANAALAPEPLRAVFGADRYHGAVVWSWQQALAAAGIERQLRRTDLPAEVLALLREAQARLWAAIHAAREVANSELWSWQYDAASGYRVHAFGPESATADESNVAQLWSTVYLAVQPPVAA